MKARNLYFFAPSMKMSRRYCDYSHHPLTILDRIVLYFATVEWIRTPSGKVEPFVGRKRWRYYFRRVPS